MLTRSSWIWCWITGAVLASSASAQVYVSLIDNLPTCIGNRNGRIISVSDAVDDSDCSVGGATGDARFVHPCICDTLNALGPYWKAVGGSGGSSGPATALESPVVIEGTADAFEGNFTFADPTADWTWAWGATGAVSGVPSITGGTSGTSTLTLDGDSTVTGDATVTTAGRITTTGGVASRTDQATTNNSVASFGSSGSASLDVCNSTGCTGYGGDSSVVVLTSLQVYGNAGASGIKYEGTDDTSETFLVATNATADRTITLPNATGTVSTFVGVPANAAVACSAGQYSYDASYFYVCTASGAWMRAAIATW